MNYLRRLAANGVFVAGLAGLVSCGHSQTAAQKTPLDTIVGVPKMPAYHVHGNSSPAQLSFVLAQENGKDVLCEYKLRIFDKGVDMSPIAAAVIDAHEDKQQLTVRGRLDTNCLNRLEMYEIRHPDFGLFVLRNE